MFLQCWLVATITAILHFSLYLDIFKPTYPPPTHTHTSRVSKVMGPSVEGSLFIVAPIVCSGFVFGPCFVI